MEKTVEVIFPADALPGVRAVGSIVRGQKASVSAAEALRLVDAKGLAFASPADEKAARQPATETVRPEPSIAPATPDEEH